MRPLEKALETPSRYFPRIYDNRQIIKNRIFGKPLSSIWVSQHMAIWPKWAIANFSGVTEILKISQNHQVNISVIVYGEQNGSNYYIIIISSVT